jgi:hypothetical protein
MANSNEEDEAAIQLAKAWAGQTVTIKGVGGWLSVDNTEDSVRTNPARNAATKATKIDIEAAPENFGDPSAVVFRVVFDNDDGTQNTSNTRYLTNIMYGDTHRQAAAQALAAIPALVLDAIPLTVDFAIGRPTEETNFEGSGFNYSSMTAQPGPVTRLQLFRLERPNNPRNDSSFGVKSLFGTYWRSQHWDESISQSPHCLEDETWYFVSSSSGSGSGSGGYDSEEEEVSVSGSYDSEEEEASGSGSCDSAEEGSGSVEEARGSGSYDSAEEEEEEEASGSGS